MILNCRGYFLRVLVGMGLLISLCSKSILSSVGEVFLGVHDMLDFFQGAGEALLNYRGC